MFSVFVACSAPFLLFTAIVCIWMDQAKVAILLSLVGCLLNFLISLSVLLKLDRAPYNLIVDPLVGFTFGGLLSYWMITTSLVCFAVFLIARSENNTVFKLKPY